jgi:outer membrane protein, multidrug efflux system
LQRGHENPWEGFFLDERLRQLITQMLENNRDLRIAVARIEEARGLYRIQNAEQLPQLGSSTGITRNRIGGNSLGSQNGGVAVSSGSGITSTNYDIGVAVTSFELDFWGRVRNLNDAARAQYLATVAGERAFRIALIRDLATAYITSRSLAEQADQADLALETRERGLRLAKLRLDAGVTSALDYRQAEALLTQAQTEVASLRNQQAKQRNIVRLLVGSPIDEDALAPARRLGDQDIIRDIDAGLPSALLANRPDIIQAEEALRAARANVGAARAAFFPTISLTGSAGFASSSLDNLFSDNSLNWSFGPSISLPIFDWGARKGNLTVARARETIEVATYERTVQIAFREVSDALADRKFLAEQLIAQERAVEAQTALTRLARLRYENGVAQFLEVLDAERNLFSAQQTLIQLRGAQSNSLITLYAALGGGLGPIAPENGTSR